MSHTVLPGPRPFLRRCLPLVTLVLFAAALGCASGEPADVEPPAPVKDPFVAPEWESTEYRSDDGVFFVHYPSDFEAQPSEDPNNLLTVASPSMVPRVDVSRVPTDGETTMESFADDLETSLAETGGGEAEVTASETVTLRDGVTGAWEYVVDWTFQGFPLNSLVLLAPAGDDTYVNVMVTGMSGGDLEELRDIAYTLYFP